jgi:hypothetical protein
MQGSGIHETKHLGRMPSRHGAAKIAVSHDKPGLPVIGINGSIEAADVDRLNAVVFLRSRMALPYKLARS